MGDTVREDRLVELRRKVALAEYHYASRGAVVTILQANGVYAAMLHGPGPPGQVHYGKTIWEALEGAIGSEVREEP